MNGFLKANAWHLVHSLVLVALLIGQWGERQEVTARDLQRLEQRVATVESWTQAERPRLDPVYLAREVALTQNAAIIQRLEAIEAELREVRKALR